VMGMMSRVPKSGHNDFHNYDYATSEDVADTVREALAEVGIAFIVSIDNIEREGLKTICDYTFTFVDGDTGEMSASAWKGEAQDGSEKKGIGDKGISKATTSAVKYFLLKTFLISTGDEPDADSEKQEANRETPMIASVSVEASKQYRGELEQEPTTVRPYSPVTVRAGIAKAAEKHVAFDPNQAQQNLLRHGLELCFVGDEAAEHKRHVVLAYLTGHPSTKETSGKMFKAIIEDWLKIKQPSSKGGEYAVDPMAIKEAQSIVTEALKEEGQQELSL